MNEREEFQVWIGESLANLPEANLKVVRHLLACEKCLARWLESEAGRELSPGGGGPAPAGLDPGSFDPGPVLRRLAEEKPGLLRALEDRALRARGLLRRLLAAPGGEREALAASREFRNVPFANLLLVESAAAQPEEAGRSEDLARLALAATPTVYAAEQALLVREVKVRAHALLGNARRLAGDLAVAEGHLERARALLEGEVVSSASALYCQNLGLLRLDQGQRNEGSALLAFAASLYGRCGERQDSRCCLAEYGMRCLDEGHLESATEALTQACAGLDYRQAPKLGLRSRLSLALCYAALGRRTKAVLLVERTRPLYGSFTQATPGVEQIAWLEGRVAAFTGARAKAEEAFEQVRRCLAAQSRPEAALVALDLELLLLGRNPSRPLDDLLRGVLPRMPESVRRLAVSRARVWYAASLWARRRRRPERARA